MHVKDRPHHLLHQLCCYLLGETRAAIFDDTVEELTASTKLHDEVNVSRIFEGFIKLDYVGMVQDFHYLYLVGDCLGIHRTLTDTLYCADSSSSLVDGSL